MTALMTVAELARAVGALEVRGDGRIAFSSVSTDTRSLTAGALFVALRGEHFDAHEFVGAARRSSLPMRGVRSGAAPRSGGRASQCR
jgi:UDP-N-acetylmuramoyl-tripeptide--D-alanyl-D-alanine ligase